MTIIQETGLENESEFKRLYFERYPHLADWGEDHEKMQYVWRRVFDTLGVYLDRKVEEKLKK
jgi:actin-related protein